MVRAALMLSPAALPSAIRRRIGALLEQLRAIDFRSLPSRVSASLARSLRNLARSLHPLTLFRAVRARGWLWLLSVVFVCAVFFTYLYHWLEQNWPMLADATLQTDDARIVMPPFHQYGEQGTLGDDPVASEQLAYVPPGAWLLYRVLVPLTDLYVTSKLVQVIAYGIVFAAGLVLVRRSRAGLGAGLLLIFLILHDEFAVDRIAGGLPRAFAFPCFALWLAGAVAERRRARWASAVISALTYPSATTMILAAEGVYALRGMTRGAWYVVARRLKRYAGLVVVCIVCLVPAMLGGEERGPIHTLEQAQDEPAFGRRGRLRVLPLEDPLKAFSRHMLDPLKVEGKSPLEEWRQWYKDHGELYAMTFLALLFALPLLRLSAPPWHALAFFVGVMILYALARLYAFKLYSPERYYSFGARMVTLMLVAGLFGSLLFFKRGVVRATTRNVACGALMLGLWFATGDGIKPNNGMTISTEHHPELYAFIRTLPKDARIAAHPLDSDGIPYLGARANLGGWETIQPWFVKSWQTQRTRAEHTLDAMYATDVTKVLDYARRYDVSHFLVNKHRYRSNYTREAGVFEPLSSYVRQLLRDRPLDQLVFRRVNQDAVVFEHGRFQIVSVDALRRTQRQ